MRKSSYLLRLALLAMLSVSALTAPARRCGAQASAAVGSEQTPIDIRDEEVTFDPNLPALGFSYGTKVTLSVVNTGSPGEFATVRAELPDGGGELSVAGVTYNRTRPSVSGTSTRNHTKRIRKGWPLRSGR